MVRATVVLSATVLCLVLVGWAAPTLCLAQASEASSGTLTNGGFSAEGAQGPASLSGPAMAGGGAAHGHAAVQAIAPLYDFGTVYNGTVVKHIFTLKNTGTAPLIIGGVQTSCGCTAAQPTVKHVLPDQESAIAVSFDTQADHGPATRTITVFTNDPRRARVELTMRGDVKLQVKVSPSLVIFDKTRQGSAQSRQVTLADQMPDHVFTVRSITNSNHNIKVTSQPQSSGPGALLTITLLKTTPAGPVTDLVKASTSRGLVEIPVSGTVIGDLNVNPPQVSFGVVAHHAGALRIVRLTNSGQHPVNVTGISSNSLSVIAGVEPLKAGREYKITLQLRPGTPDGVLHGMVAVKTDDPHQQQVQIPFYGIIGSFKS